VSEIDLIVNCWERTVRHVVRRGYFTAIEESNCHKFRKILLINNVNDLNATLKRADQLIAYGELDEYYIVAEKLPAALKKANLSRGDLGEKILHYSDAPLVAVTLESENDWLLYWDAEISLISPFNWCTEAMFFMDENPDIIVANPSWQAGSVDREALYTTGMFSVGYGFSDQVFLARRSDLAKVQWDCRCIASLRYPLSHIAPDFEQRLDAFMRRYGKLRATFMNATYEHPNEGSSYPFLSTREYVRRRLFNTILKALEILPGLNTPCLKINPARSLRL
jgi:hypothetical protein